jgi:tetratricopeptide (TPR) repeat protein
MQPPKNDSATAAGEPSVMSSSATPPIRAENLETIAIARQLLQQGEAEAAMQKLRPVFEEDRAHAQVRSWYGLTLGLARHRYHEALDLCQSAVKQEFFNPDLYLNVAQLNLAFGFRAESLRYLRRARMIDPGNQEIHRLLEELGPRAQPVLRFLPRRHVLNRWLGTARHVLRRRVDAPADPEPEADVETRADHVAA